MTYTLFEHRHNFSVWCSARAVQRGFTDTETLRKALESCGVVEFVKNYDGSEISTEDFDRYHENWCNKVLETLNKDQKDATYGRVAKLVNVYIKSMIVNQNQQTPLSHIAHPPIDRILLKNIAKDEKINHTNKKNWGKIKWTYLNKEEYQKLINDFRQIVGNNPFWTIERYWTVTDEYDFSTTAPTNTCNS